MLNYCCCLVCRLSLYLLVFGLPLLAQAKTDRQIKTIYGDPRDSETQGLAFVGMADDNLMELVFNEGQIIPGQQVPYTQAEGDEYVYWLKGKEREHQWVKRNGKDYGIIVGKNRDMLWRFDEFMGEWDERNWLNAPTSYQIISSDDAAFSSAAAPVKIHRKSVPTGYAQTGIGQGKAPVRHTVYLELKEPLKPGKTYQLQVANPSPIQIEFTFNPAQQHSNAIHVNQTGFRPDDPAKLAFLSTWLGEGGTHEYQDAQPFHLVDTTSGEQKFSGTAKLRLAAEAAEGDATKRNYNLTPVYEMDFSGFDQAGEYTVMVEGIGRSYPFRIAPDAWRQPFRTGLRGFLHQRSGIELDPTIADHPRPRNMHPADPQVTIYHTTTTLADVLASGLGMMEVFKEINDGRTEEVVDTFWGGYHDAGDWDRRTHHLAATRLKLELLDLFPDQFLADDWGWPESGNGLPDLLDEVRWNLDAYGRSQTPDGGIRGGVESAEHPITGEASWQESLPIMAFAPGIWGSYVFAGDAARMAHLLGKLEGQDELAASYRQQAVRAFDFAEDKWKEGVHDPMPFEIRDSRNLAAAELFRLTGEPSYHEIFHKTLAIKKPKQPLAKWGTRKDNAGYDQADAAFVYLNTERPEVDPAIAQVLRQAYVNQAKKMAKLSEQSGFAWTMPDATAPLGWGRPATSQAVILARAHHLTGEDRYLKAALNASLFGLGANPSNLVFTTGLGSNPIRRPHHRDSRYTGVAAPSGISVYGPFDVTRYHQQPGAKKNVDPYIWPAWKDWPPTESHIDNYELYMTNEFTVYQTMGPNAYVWGYLHARPKRPEAAKESSAD